MISLRDKSTLLLFMSALSQTTKIRNKTMSSLTQAFYATCKHSRISDGLPMRNLFAIANYLPSGVVFMLFASKLVVKLLVDVHSPEAKRGRRVHQLHLLSQCGTGFARPLSFPHRQETNSIAPLSQIPPPSDLGRCLHENCSCLIC